MHVHEYAEAWYIVDGTYGFYCDGVWRRAAAGSFVYASPGVPHAIAALPGSGCHKISLMLNPDSADNATKFAMDLQGMIDVPWRPLLGGAEHAEGEAVTPSFRAAATRSLVGAEHLFDINFEVDAPKLISDGDGGNAMIVQSRGGRFEGAGCSGVVRSATDWASRDAEGVVAVDIRAVLEDDDGSSLLLEQRGTGVREDGDLTIFAAGRIRADPASQLGHLNGTAISALGTLVHGGVRYAVYRQSVSMPQRERADPD